MKILIYSPYSLENNSMSVLLDEAIDYLKTPGNNVLFITCGGEIKPCDSNAEQSLIRCLECNISTQILINKIHFPGFEHKKIFHFIKKSDIEKIQSQKFDYNTIDDVKQISYKGINIGMGVVSSYVSMTRNLNPYFNKSNKKYIDASLRAAAVLTEATFCVVNSFEPDLILLFNGRYGGLRPIIEVSQKNGIKYKTLECTFSGKREIQRKVTFENMLPHEIDGNSLLMEQYWNEYSGNLDKEILASEFFQRRRKAEMASDNIYTENQEPDLLPQNWNKNKRNFVIFNSSEDEFFCVGETFDKYKLFESQIEGIHYLLQITRDDPEVHFYLRVHPNLKDIKFKYASGLTKEFEKYPNITVIPSDSPISTYKLIDNCEKVLVFGSTAGVESTYWGKPVILLGGAFYYHLDVSYNPKNLNELKILLHEKLKPKEKIGALKYALYIYGERGVRYRNINYDYKLYRFAQKVLSLPLCYAYKESMIPYLLFVILFRSINIIHHLIFKKITLKKLQTEKI